MTRAIVLAIALCSFTARATDCERLEAIEPDHVVSEAQLRCVQLELAARAHDADTANAALAEKAVQLAACEATSSIACPPPPGPPVVEVTVASAISLVIGTLIGLLIAASIH